MSLMLWMKFGRFCENDDRLLMGTENNQILFYYICFWAFQPVFWGSHPFYLFLLRTTSILFLLYKKNWGIGQNFYLFWVDYSVTSYGFSMKIADHWRSHLQWNRNTNNWAGSIIETFSVITHSFLNLEQVHQVLIGISEHQSSLGHEATEHATEGQTYLTASIN